MKKLLLILTLFISVMASAQSKPGYTTINSRYDWLAGVFKSGIHVTSGNTPALATGQWNGDGALFFDSLHRRLSYYWNGNWYGLRDTTEGGSNTSIGTGFDIGWTGTNNVRRVDFYNGGAADTAVANTVRFRLGGSDLSVYTAIGLNGFPLNIVHNGVNNAAQSDSNSIKLINNTAAATSTDSLVSPSLSFSVYSRKTNSGGSSRNVEFIWDAMGLATSGNGLAVHRLMTKINGATPVTIFSIQSNGDIPDPLSLHGNRIGSIGTGNVFFGQSALLVNAGSNNTAIGGSSLQANTTGIYNTALGQLSLASNKIGSYNTAVGALSLDNASDSSYNSALGYGSLHSNTKGYFNTSVGAQSLFTNTTGQANTAVGMNALAFTTTADKNTAIGAGAMENNTTGGFNSFLGEDAGLHNTTGTENTGNGWLSGAQNLTGSSNVSQGSSSARNIHNANKTVYIGSESGYLDTAGANSQKDTALNTIAVGYRSFNTADNQIWIGNGSHNDLRLEGIVAGAGTYALRYNPTTKRITYGDTTSGGGAGGSYSAGYGLNLTSTTFSADTTIVVNKAGPQVIAGSKTFTGETRIGSGVDKGTPILQVTGKQYNYGTDETDGGYHLGYVDGSQNTGRIYRDGGTGGMVVENFIAKMTFIASGTGIDMYGASGAPIQLRPQGSGVSVGPSASTPTALLHVQAGTTSFPSQVIVEGAKTIVAVDGAIEKDDAFYMTKTNAVRYGVGGTLKTNYTDVGNVGGGEDNLQTFSVPAGTLSQDGDYLEFCMSFSVAANATLKVYYGATQLFSLSALATDAVYLVTGKVIRTGATTQRATGLVSSGLGATQVFYQTPGETLSGAVTLKATGEGVSNNDIIQTTSTVKYFPAN